MRLNKLTLLNFRNIARAELSFPGRINCLVGCNGAGKTNVLEALHYLSVGRGALGLSDQQSVLHGEDFFMAEGHYTADGGLDEQITCSYKRDGGKAMCRSGKQYERLSDHLGLVPVVVVLPQDVLLVSDAAEERRRYLNSFISQLDRAYLDAVIRYNTILAQRNRLLKEWAGRTSEEMIEVLDMQLSQYGHAIHARRAGVIGMIAPRVAEYYAALSGDTEQVGIAYRSELSETPMDELLRASRERDRVNRFTTCGVHRDDLVMTIGGLPLKKYGSQGQQKSLLVALKLSQYQAIRESSDEHPVLLLDDLFDKLDAGRVGRLIGLVSGEDFGQIFITDCNGERLGAILENCGQPYTLFDVEGGEITSAP